MDFHQAHSQKNPGNVRAGQKFIAWIARVVLCIFQNSVSAWTFFQPPGDPLDFHVFWKWVLMTSFCQILGSSEVLAHFLMLGCLVSVAVSLSLLTYLLFLHSSDATCFFSQMQNWGIHWNSQTRSIANLCLVYIVHKQKSQANLSQNWGRVLRNPLKVFPTRAQLCWLKLHPFLRHGYHLYTTPL